MHCQRPWLGVSWVSPRQGRGPGGMSMTHGIPQGPFPLGPACVITSAASCPLGQPSQCWASLFFCLSVLCSAVHHAANFSAFRDLKQRLAKAELTVSLSASPAHCSRCFATSAHPPRSSAAPLSPGQPPKTICVSHTPPLSRAGSHPLMMPTWTTAVPSYQSVSWPSSSVSCTQAPAHSPFT